MSETSGNAGASGGSPATGNSPGGNAAATAVPGGAGGGAGVPWYQGLAGVDQEILGHWQNKGWHTTTAAEVAVEATRAHRQAEKFIGVPADQVIRIPQADDAAGWNNVWNRLGRPADASGYDFSGVQFADGSGLDEDFTAMMRATAHRLNLPKEAATALTADFAKYLDKVEAGEKTQTDALLATARDELRKNWGANFDANMFVARKAAERLGVAEAVNALENTIGYAKTMEMFRAIGQSLGEDRYVTGGGTGVGQGGVMTREQAIARKAELMGDAEWRKSYLDGDAAKKREMEALIRLSVDESRWL